MAAMQPDVNRGRRRWGFSGRGGLGQRGGSWATPCAVDRFLYIYFCFFFFCLFFFTFCILFNCLGIFAKPNTCSIISIAPNRGATKIFGILKTLLIFIFNMQLAISVVIA